MVQMVIQDTPGLANLKRLRPQLYFDADAVIISFSLDDPASLFYLQQLWVPEVRRYCGDVPILLAATKADLRLNTVPKSRSTGCLNVLPLRDHFDTNNVTKTLEVTGKASSYSSQLNKALGHQTDVLKRAKSSQDIKTSIRLELRSERHFDVRWRSSSACASRLSVDKDESPRLEALCKQVTQQCFYSSLSAEEDVKLTTILSRLDAEGFFQTSAVLNIGVTKVFEAAFAAALSSRQWRQKYKL